MQFCRIFIFDQVLNISHVHRYGEVKRNTDGNIPSYSKDLVIGTDDEKAMVMAIQTAFPEATHVLCTRHLVQNAKQKLTDDVDTKSDKYVLIDNIFGEDGLVERTTPFVFIHKIK